MARDESLETIYISDSEPESDRHQLLPTVQIPLVNTQGGRPLSASSLSQYSDVLVIDSTDSEDLEDLEAQLKKICFQKKTNARSRHPISSLTPPASHVKTPRGSELQDDVLVLSSSEEETVPLGRTAHHGALNSNSPLKKAHNTSTRMPNHKGNVSRRNLNVQEKEVIKEQTRLQRDINKIVNDKKSTLKDFTVEVSRTFEDHPFIDCLKTKLAVHGCSIMLFDPPSLSEPLIRFRRQHIARYDNKLKEWIPVAHYHALEDLYVLLLSAATIALAVSEETLAETLSVLRSTHRLTARSQIFLMIDGLNAYYKHKRTPKVKRNAIETALAALQASEKCFIVQVEGSEDTAQWLFNITGDLGMFLLICEDVWGYESLPYRN
ncbi:hypothetical protein RSOLAG1IB_00936 [Rhizoctonia solani AG-1 IB]|uniref:ERCC4 domain-containing protein n=1 Tax=Thanatephorus cucumeris (strain AG1-IB / isolate 7/3/14) TaxID=1108050 RepID=A0A0B7F4C4_THACB|nr:hypothetical protein RSOLAG1IB_00936 [Rhizoctonia solani AG-1 IB]